MMGKLGNSISMILIMGILLIRLNRIRNQKADYLSGKRVGYFQSPKLDYWNDLVMTIFSIILSAILLGISLFLQLSN